MRWWLSQRFPFGSSFLYLAVLIFQRGRLEILPGGILSALHDRAGRSRIMFRQILAPDGALNAFLRRRDWLHWRSSG